MGDKQSKPAPQARQANQARQASQAPQAHQASANPLLTKPWRDIKFVEEDWNLQTKAELTTLIREFQLVDDDAGLNVLFIGQVSAGKSSLFNNIETVFQSYVADRAPTGISNTDVQTLTKRYKMYDIIDRKTNKPIKFRFWDTMGVEGKDAGLKLEDVIRMLDGTIPTNTDLTKRVYPGSEETQTTGGEINCVVFIINAATVALMDPVIVKKFSEIREEANGRDMNPIVVLTHVDQICKATEENTSKVFLSRSVQDKVKAVTEKLGTQEKMLCPVVNYTGQQETDVKIDILTLLLLRQILRSCENRLKR